MGAAQRGRELGSVELGGAVAWFHCAGVAFGQVWLFILVGVSGGGVVALQLEGSSARSSCTKFPSRLRFPFLAAPLLLVLKAGSCGSPVLSLALCSALSWLRLLPCMRSPHPLGGREGLKGRTEPLHIPPCLQLELLSLSF